MNHTFFDGRLASDPEIETRGTSKLLHFTLIENEYAGKDGQGNRRPDRKVSINFSAWDHLAELIANNCFQGDTLHVRARIENNKYDKEGVTIYTYNFVAQEVKLGAPGPKKRAQFAQGQE